MYFVQGKCILVDPEKRDQNSDSVVNTNDLSFVTVKGLDTWLESEKRWYIDSIETKTAPNWGGS
jgi:hypothetical protein